MAKVSPSGMLEGCTEKGIMSAMNDANVIDGGKVSLRGMQYPSSKFGTPGSSSGNKSDIEGPGTKNGYPKK